MAIHQKWGVTSHSDVGEVCKFCAVTAAWDASIFSQSFQVPSWPTHTLAATRQQAIEIHRMVCAPGDGDV
jgi:hypothetical protein